MLSLNWTLAGGVDAQPIAKRIEIQDSVNFEIIGGLALPAPEEERVNEYRIG
jgi:hypothetical protein